MFSILFAALCAVSASLFSFASTATLGDCPDYTLKRVDMRVEYGVNLPCSGLSGTIGGVTLTSATACPAFIVVEPMHWDPVHTPGCDTYVEAFGFWEIRQYTFQCKRGYFLIFPLGTSCTIASERVVARNPGYVLKPCWSGPEAIQ